MIATLRFTLSMFASTNAREVLATIQYRSGQSGTWILKSARGPEGVWVAPPAFPPVSLPAKAACGVPLLATAPPSNPSLVPGPADAAAADAADADVAAPSSSSPAVPLRNGTRGSSALPSDPKDRALGGDSRPFRSLKSLLPTDVSTDPGLREFRVALGYARGAPTICTLPLLLLLVLLPLLLLLLCSRAAVLLRLLLLLLVMLWLL